MRALPRRYRVRVNIEPGTHASELAINKQLNDKERVLAAMENAHLIRAVDTCLARTVQ
jgi:predicted dienelactone hydrolase